MLNRLRANLSLRLGLVPALLALAVGFSGCFGGDDEEVKELLKRAFRQPIGSADVSLDGTLQTRGATQQSPFRVKMTGAYSTNGPTKLPSLDLDATLARGPTPPITAGIASNGDNIFLIFQGTAYEIGADFVRAQNKILEKQAKDRKGGGFSAFGVDPSSWVKDGEKKGEETVAGVKTTRVSVEIEVSKMLADLNKVVGRAGQTIGGPVPPPLSDEQRENIEDTLGEPKFDVYVGKDDEKVRRISGDIEFELDGDEGGPRGARGAGLSFSIELANVGGDQKITTPTKAKPISELSDQIRELLGSGLPGGGGGADRGGGGRGGGQPPSGSGGGSSPDAERFRKYGECLRDANPEDVAELQKCAELLRR